MGTPSSSEIRYEFTPWDGTPGKPFDDYETSLLNAGSRSDDRGWTLSDHLLGQDEGSPGGPPIPGGAAGVKATAAFRKRQKESYKIVTLHIVNRDIVDTMRRDHFQNGLNAFTAARTLGNVAVDMLRLRELTKDFDGIAIIHDTGVNENTIVLLAQKIRTPCTWSSWG